MTVIQKSKLYLIISFIGFLFGQSSVYVEYWDLDDQVPIQGATWELYRHIDGEWVYVSTNNTGIDNSAEIIAGENYRIRTQQNIDGVNKHFLHWGSIVSDISIFKDFTAAIGSQSYQSNFMSKVYIEINLPEQVDIWIHDPWKVDESGELLGAEHYALLRDYCEDGLCEVFPNQGFEGDWSYPYYKINAKRLVATTGSLPDDYYGHIYRLYELNENGEISDPTTIFNFDPVDMFIDSIEDVDYHAIANIEFLQTSVHGVTLNYLHQDTQSDYEYVIYEGENLNISSESVLIFEGNNRIRVLGHLEIDPGADILFKGDLGDVSNTTGFKIFGSLKIGEQDSNAPVVLHGLGSTQEGWGWQGITAFGNAHVYIYNSEITHANRGVAYSGYNYEDFENPWGQGYIDIRNTHFHNNYGASIFLNSAWVDDDISNHVLIFDKNIIDGTIGSSSIYVTSVNRKAVIKNNIIIEDAIIMYEVVNEVTITKVINQVLAPNHIKNQRQNRIYHSDAGCI